MIFVFLILRVIPFLSESDFNADNILSRPVCDFERRRRSSAHMRHPITDPSFTFTGSHSGVSTCPCRSARYILKSIGLSIQPCFTPWLAIKVGVKCFEIFMQAISLD